MTRWTKKAVARDRWGGCELEEGDRGDGVSYMMDERKEG